MKKEIQVNDYSARILEALPHGILLNTKANGRLNSMVIGWGTLGVDWSEPVFLVYVRHSRYTHELLDANPEFTISVPLSGNLEPKLLQVLGSESGRTEDKIAKAGLTPVDSDCISVPGFAEVPLTLECRVLSRAEQDPALLQQDLRDQYYPGGEDPHTIYYGKILKAYIIE